MKRPDTAEGNMKTDPTEEIPIDALEFPGYCWGAPFPSYSKPKITNSW